MIESLGIGAAAAMAAFLGVLGGIGGAVLLVPALVLAGMSTADAAPLGLVMVAASSIAAAPRQLAERSVNHRLGVSTELAATFGAIVGAMTAGAVSGTVLTYSLALAAGLAAVAGARRSGLRNPPDPDCGPDDLGERVGSLAGAYPLGDEVVPYRPRRLPFALVLTSIAGLMAGTAGVSGGFIKTPAMSEIMGAPTKVAASTTTFTVGITAATALSVYALHGRIDAQASAVVIAASLLGGTAGAHAQVALHPARVRSALSLVLAVVAVVLVVQA